MSNRSIGLSEELHAYLVASAVREPKLLRRLREETAALPEARMQIAPEQGRFMAWLASLTGARNYLEVGTFTGYSALWVALALPPEGRVITCDISEEWTGVARRYWREAGVAERIELRLAPATDTLGALLAEGRAGSFDLAFIDADKERYLVYYERVLELLRGGGVVAADNVLWGGAVIDRDKDDADTLAIRRFNEHLAADERVDICLVPIGDGLTLARKR